MRVAPALAEFLSDPVRQALVIGHGQRARRAWVATPTYEHLSRTLKQLSDTPPDDVGGFARHLAQWTADFAWLDDLVARWVALLRNDPFVDVPWQPQVAAVMQGLTILQEGSANCSVIVVDGVRLTGAARDHIVCDSGYNLLTQVAGPPLTIARYVLDPTADRITLANHGRMAIGTPVVVDCAREQVVIVDAASDAVVVRFSLALPGTNSRVSEYCCVSGERVRTACGDGAVSRMLALLDVASAASAADLGPVLHDLSAHPDPQLRWQAMRLWLTRDLSSATPVLDRMAQQDADTGVRSVARATRDIVQMHLSQMPDARQPVPADS